jgi:hypothetical protein
MPTTIIHAGVWYEVEITECLTYVILRDKFGAETKFYNDEEGWAEFDIKF